MTIPSGLGSFSSIARGKGIGAAFGSVVSLRFPTDPAGSSTLTMTNVVAGSRYRVERQGDGSLATPTANAEGVAGASTVAISLDFYGSGNPNNDLRIKVRKATGGTTYKPFETQVTVGVASQSVFIGQIED